MPESINDTMSSSEPSTVVVRVSSKNHQRCKDIVNEALTGKYGEALEQQAERGVTGIVDTLLYKGIESLKSGGEETSVTVSDVSGKHIIIFNCKQSRVEHRSISKDGRQVNQPSIRQGEKIMFDDVEIEFRWVK